MSDLGKIQGEVSLDTTNADQALARVDANAKKMAQGVAKSGEDAAAGIKRVGDGAEEAAQKSSRAMSSLSAALKRAQSDTQRLIVDAQGYARNSAEGLEELARRRGVDAAALDGQFKALRQVRSELDTLVAAQREASAVALFERQHQDAKKLVQDAQYVRMWTEALEEKEAAERKQGTQTAFIESLRKQSEALGKTRADLLEMEAAKMGVTTQAAPFIARLRATEQGIAGMGVSAGQTAAALRQLPAQFSDIIVSLQGGQAPFTVFLQQGSQIKDSFGGAGEALRAMAGYVAGLANPFTLVAAGVAVLSLAYYQGSKEADQYRKSIVLTGNAAGVSVSQLQTYAKQISTVVGTQGAAAESLAAMASTGKVSGSVLREAAQAAVAYGRATGQAVGDTAEQFASLAREPLSGVLKLNDGMNFLTESAYRQIKSLEEQGRVADAARVAQLAYASSLETRSKSIESNLGYLEKGWLAIKDAAKGAWDRMLNVGRDDTIAQQIAKVQRDIAQAQGMDKNRPFAMPWDTPLSKLQDQLSYLQELERITKRSADADARLAEGKRLLFEWDKQGDDFKTKAAKRDEEIQKAEIEGRALIAARLITEADLRQRIADINKRYEEKKSGSAGVGQNEVAALRARANEAERYLQQLREQGLEAEKLTAGEREANKIREELRTNVSGAARAEKELALAEAERIAVAERASVNEKERLAGLEKSKTAYESLIDATRQTAQSLAQQADELEASNAMWGKGRAAVEEYRLAVLQAKLAEVEGGSDGSYDPAYVEALRAQVAAQTRKVDQQRIADFKTLNEQAQQLLRSAQDGAAMYEAELRVIGLTEDARARIVAQRAIELKYAQELDKINKSGATEADKEVARSTLKDAKTAELAGATSKAALDSLKELDAYLDPARAKDFGTALKDAFGEAGNSLAQLTNAFQDFAQQQAQLTKMQEKLRSSAGKIDQDEYYKREQDLAKKSAQLQIGSYASIAGAAKGFFKEHSKGYNAMATAEKAFRAMEMAMAVQSLAKQLSGVTAITSAKLAGDQAVTASSAASSLAEAEHAAMVGQMNAGVAITNQASKGDPYTAFARMAAMAAAMAAIGFAVSGAGGSSTSAVREERQRTQGTGTVFGDSEAKSGSLGNALDMLADSAKIELRYQSGMLSSLRNIENAMAGVANAVLRTAGITSGNSLGIFEGILSTNKGDPIMNALGLGGLDFGSKLPGIGGVIGKLQSLWGKTKQEITDSGLVINGLVGQLSRGEGFSQYTDVTTTKSSFFGLSKSSKSNTVFGELDAETNDALGRVFRGLSSSLVLAAAAFGRDATEVGNEIANTLIDIPRTSLRDLKGQDLQDAISSVISAAADTIGKTVTPGLEDFQKVGEGYFETIVRVATGIEQADYALERFGITAIGFQDVVGKQGDVAAEIFRDSVAKFEGAGKGITQIMQGVSGSVDELADTYTGLVEARNLLKSVGANGSDPSFALLRGAGGLDGLRDGLENYLNGFFSETERYAAASARLAEQFASLGVPQPKDIAAFRALASGLDQSDEASAQLFGRLMNLADAFYDVASAVEQSEARLKSAFDDVAPDWLAGDELRAYRASRIAEGLAQTGLSVSAETLLGATAESFRALYDAIDKTSQVGREQATALLNAWGSFKDMNADAEAAAQAAAERAQAAAQAIAEAQAQAAQKVREAWKGIADSIVDEIKRIRGEMVGDGASGLASVQSQFAIATAQARAGDEEAAKSLPTLSRKVLELAEKTSRSALDFQILQGQIASSLLETAKSAARRGGTIVPAFASGGVHSGGVALVGERGPELVSLAPSRIFNASQTANMLDQSALLEEMRLLRNDNREQARKFLSLNFAISKVLTKWDADGMPKETA